MKTMRSITSVKNHIEEHNLDKNQERNKGLGKKQRTQGDDLVKNREEDEDKALRESRHRTRNHSSLDSFL
jgi:hypothetical protein